MRAISELFEDGLVGVVGRCGFGHRDGGCDVWGLKGDAARAWAFILPSDVSRNPSHGSVKNESKLSGFTFFGPINNI
jgi:hypothetical protein